MVNQFKSDNNFKVKMFINECLQYSKCAVGSSDNFISTGYQGCEDGSTVRKLKLWGVASCLISAREKTCP